MLTTATKEKLPIALSMPLPQKEDWLNYHGLKCALTNQLLKIPVVICLQGKLITVEQSIAEDLRSQGKITEIRRNYALQSFIEEILQNPKKIPEHCLQCPIKIAFMEKPFMTKEGITYELSALKEMCELAESKGNDFRDPMTKNVFKISELCPNNSIKRIIDLLEIIKSTNKDPVTARAQSLKDSFDKKSSSSHEQRLKILTTLLAAPRPINPEERQKIFAALKKRNDASLAAYDAAYDQT